MTIDGVDVTVENIPDITKEEIRQYIAYVHSETKKPVTRLRIEAKAPNDVVLHWNIDNQPFERIRRITGYLVGTIDRWNNAKRSEERERVKHA